MTKMKLMQIFTYYICRRIWCLHRKRPSVSNRTSLPVHIGYKSWIHLCINGDRIKI